MRVGPVFRSKYDGRGVLVKLEAPPVAQVVLEDRDLKEYRRSSRINRGDNDPCLHGRLFGRVDLPCGLYEGAGGVWRGIRSYDLETRCLVLY